MKVSVPLLFDKLSLSKSSSNYVAFWQKALARDIENLLNESCHSARLDLSKYEHVEQSVLNLGYSVFSESIPISTNPSILAKKIAKILVAFEPRLDPDTIKVIPIIDGDDQHVLSILFDIYAKSYMSSSELILNLRVALDYSYGVVKVI